jgi:HEAT repeat protein
MSEPSDHEQSPSEQPPPDGAPEIEPGEDRGFASDMGRLFLIPAVIVALSVVIFMLFTWIAGERRSARDYLQEVRNGVTGRRWQAAFELSRVLARDENERKDPRVVREIAGTLTDPEVTDPQVKRYLILALEQIGDPSTAEAIRSLLGDEDPEVRLYAARALGSLRDSASAPLLREMLSDEDPAMRKMALHALGRVGDRAAIPEMRARLEDPVEDVRWNAALGLAVLGDASGEPLIRRMLDPAYLDGVAEITEPQKVAARLAAVQGAFLIGGGGMRELIEQVSGSDADLKVRDAALKALEAWPDE